MSVSVAVAVSAILLLLFLPFSLIFNRKTMALDSVATLWNNWLLQKLLNAHVWPVGITIFCFTFTTLDTASSRYDVNHTDKLQHLMVGQAVRNRPM